MAILVELFRIILIALFFTLLLGPGSPAGADSFDVTNLVSDDPSVNPKVTDPSLKNAWGVSYTSSGSPFWVSSNRGGVADVYAVNGPTDTTKAGIMVTIPPAPGSTQGTPTGLVFNPASATAFSGDNFLFVSLDGTISGWRPALGVTGTAERLQVGDPANVYTGTTLVTNGANTYLLSANFKTGNIDVLKGTPGAPDLTGKFTDPNLPANFAPYNIQLLNGKIYVTYALVDSTTHQVSPGAGHGIVNAFDTQGILLGRIATMGTLNSPWGLAIAPASFGQFAGDLLVGNFGDGRINAFSLDPTHPGFFGQLSGANGPLDIDGLWALIPGNGGNSGDPSSIYFSAGPNGETHGLFGVISTIPEPSTALLLLSGIAGWLVLARRRSDA